MAVAFVSGSALVGETRPNFLATSRCHPKIRQHGCFTEHGRRRARIIRYTNTTTTVTQMQSNVPFDVPAGVLLAVSSVLAIASIGCVFELTSGHPQLGNTLTMAILLVSFPGFIGLYYAALQKGKLEADED